MLEFNSGQWIAELHKQVAQDQANRSPEFTSRVQDAVDLVRELMELGAITENPDYWDYA